MSMSLWLRWWGLASLIGLSVASVSAADLPDQDTLKSWIQEMKTAPRGPFLRLRWFCKDGTVLPPNASCQEHGGGVQHGEWNPRTKQLRASGYHIANRLADLLSQAFTKQPDYDLIVLRCSMLPKYLKLLKWGHENASPGSLANPPLASICA